LLFTAFSNRQDAVDLAREAGERLHQEGIDSNLLLLDTAETPSMDETTLVVSLGGDGTFLKSARLAHEYGARVLAVNLGRLGFLLNVPSDELIDNIKHAMRYDHAVDRVALNITFSNADGEEFALNEVVVERAHVGHMVRVK